MKACGTCNLCCRLPEIESLNKPAGQWCVHTGPGRGCAIYGDHPADCRAFACGWVQWDQLDETWKPDLAHFYIRNEPSRRRLCVDVDPAFPEAWRGDDYYPVIKQWSAGVHDGSLCVLVYVGPDVTVVFPEADIAIGGIGEDELAVGYRGRGDQRRPFVRLRRDGEVVREWLGAG
ncbi:MAG: YkgJ family cysteine cluster protein [Caulobacter sp.]|nr:YkgJ family cysteine cluster protein [Caulobacter sp.]